MDLRPSPTTNSLYDLELRSLSLPGTQEPYLKPEGAGFEFSPKSLSSQKTRLFHHRPGSILETPNPRKGPPHTSIKPMALVASGCMSPQQSQNLRTRFRAPCQMVWAVGPKTCKSKDRQTDHPKFKRSSGYLEKHLTRLDSTPVKIDNKSTTDSFIQQTLQSKSGDWGDAVIWSGHSCYPLPRDLFLFPDSSTSQETISVEGF